MGLGLGWLRAVAQCYNYSCNTIKLVSNFLNNIKSLGIKLGWGLDGCARWRKVTITVAVKLNWGLIFKGMQRVWEPNGVGAGMAARSGAQSQIQLQ